MNVVAAFVRDVAEAVIVIGPASAPVTDVVATPPEAVAEPSPLTVPVPAVFANVTLVVLSLVSTFPNASRTSTVRFRAAPDARLPVELVKVRWSAGAGLTVNEFESTAIVPVPPPLLRSALVARSVFASAALSSRRFVKTATPFTAATVVVPIAMLVSVLKEAKEKGGQVSLVNPNREIQRLLQITGLERVFRVQHSAFA